MEKLTTQHSSIMPLIFAGIIGGVIGAGLTIATTEKLKDEKSRVWVKNKLQELGNGVFETIGHAVQQELKKKKVTSISLLETPVSGLSI